MLPSFIAGQSNSLFSINRDVAVASLKLISDCRYKSYILLELLVSTSIPMKSPARKITIVIIRASQNTCLLDFNILPFIVAAEVFIECNY